MTYSQTIAYLYERLPMFSKIGSAAYKEDLHNTVALCAALNNPHRQFKSIHIAGTNGKGSTAHILAAILQQAGYKTGLYTSPHLKDFRERIKINGNYIDQNFVIDFVERTKKLFDAIEPSFFELTVAMAFEYFAQEKTDIAIIETGLGGRLDSTNIITPILSIITNIGFDHTAILGNTLDKIAEEKAGIIKPHIPVVIGECIPVTRSVFIKKAAAMQAPIYFAEEQFNSNLLTVSTKLLLINVENILENTHETFSLDLTGLYQQKNLQTVLTAQQILLQTGFTILPEATKWALANTKKTTGLRGRWDVISEHPTLVLDVAHNEDGIKQLLQQIKTSCYNIAFAGIHFVIGFVKDKEIDAILNLLPADAHYYFTNAHLPRALNAPELKIKAAAFGLMGEAYDAVNDAIDAAKQKAADTDLIIVCGSIFLVGEVAGY